jgi:carboxypeptidase family protein
MHKLEVRIGILVQELQNWFAFQIKPKKDRSCDRQRLFHASSAQKAWIWCSIASRRTPPRKKSAGSLKSFMPSRKVFMHKYRCAMEHAIARAFYKSFRLMCRCLLLGLMAAVSLKAQQSAPSPPAWTGVVRTAAGEPVAGAKVTVYPSAAKENLTAVTGTDGRFAIADIRLGPHKVSVQLPGRGPTAPAAVDILGLT